MADDPLTPAELETLLAARASAPKPAASSARQTSPGSCEPPSVARAPRVAEGRPSPPPLDDEVNRALAGIHERCAARFAAELSPLVRRTAGVKLGAVSQLTHREFAARLANPTYLNRLSAAPLPGEWILEISPTVLNGAIDCMLGGGRAPAATAERPLTEIDERLAARVASLFVRQLRAAWRPVVELELSVTDATADARASQVAAAGDMVIWIRFEIELSCARGMLNLGIPAASIAAVTQHLSGAPRGNDNHPPGSQEPTVELVACLARSQIDAGELGALGVGDVITTEQSLDAPIAVLQDGVVRFRARAGACDGHKALAIDEVVSRPDGASPGGA